MFVVFSLSHGIAHRFKLTRSCKVSFCVGRGAPNCLSLINTLCATSTVSDVVGKLESVKKVLRPCVLVNLDIYGWGVTVELHDEGVHVSNVLCASHAIAVISTTP